MAVTFQRNGKTVKTIGEGAGSVEPPFEPDAQTPITAEAEPEHFLSIKVTSENMRDLKVRAAILGVDAKVMARDALVEFLADPPTEVSKYPTPDPDYSVRFAFHVNAELADAVRMLAKSYAQKPTVSYQDIIVAALDRMFEKHPLT